MAHAAFAGALIGLWAGIPPLLSAFGLATLVAAVIGPLADRGELSPETSIGVIFSFLLGLAFLIIGLMSGSKSAALDLLWGNILTVTGFDIMVLSLVTLTVVGVTFAFYKEIQATIFNRRLALAVGIPSTTILYGILFLAGITITASLRPIGGLLIFSLILSPAAAAHQLTYSMPRMFLLSAGFGILSCWLGLLLSYLLNIPSGAAIVITASVVFMAALAFSPKRRGKTWPVERVREEQI
jgi:manganese/iron transport system permease protein